MCDFRVSSSWMVSSLCAKFVMHIFRTRIPRDLVLWTSIDVVCFLSTKWNRTDAHINCYGFICLQITLTPSFKWFVSICSSHPRQIGISTDLGGAHCYLPCVFVLCFMLKGFNLELFQGCEKIVQCTNLNRICMESVH
jgi:hypothetical protein